VPCPHRVTVRVFWLARLRMAQYYFTPGWAMRSMTTAELAIVPD
jgi:hypothetical protein